MLTLVNCEMAFARGSETDSGPRSRLCYLPRPALLWVRSLMT